MADKGSIAAIKAEIDEKIIPNNNAQLITGEKLNDTLQDTVDTLDAQHRAAIQQVADDLITEIEVRFAEDDAIRERIDEVDAAQASGVNSAVQRIEAEKAERERADESIRETLADVQSNVSWVTNEVQRVGEALDNETAAREELAQEVDQQGTRLTAAEGVGTTNTADIAVLTAKTANMTADGSVTEFGGALIIPDPEDEEQRINVGAKLNAIQDELHEKIGDLEELHTEDKSSLVGAINEVKAAKAIPDVARQLVPTGAPSEVEFSSRPTGQGVPGILGSEEVKVVKGNSIVQDGQILNNSVKAIEVTGRNLFDSATAIDRKTLLDDGGVEVSNPLGWCSPFIPVISGATYFCKGVVVNTQAHAVHFYDDNKQNISEIGIRTGGETFVVPAGVKYIRIHGIYADSPAGSAIINLSDPAFNGQYVPYVAPTTIDLEWVKDIKDGDGNVLFPDGLKGVGNVYDEAGQTKAVNRFGVKVFDGTEDWRVLPGLENAFYCIKQGLSCSSNYGNAICNYAENKVYASEFEGNSFYIRTNELGLKLAGITSVEEMKSHLADLYAQGNPLVVIYELAEPIEVTYPKQETIAAIEGGGIETAIADGNSAPFKGAILYGLDVYKTLVSLVQAQAATTAEE